jgi:mannitol-specific phosphotransferase system IIBC component
LSILFRSAANNCFKKKQISESQRNVYFVSVTEKEMINGVLQAKNASENAIVFLREIENIETDENIINNKPQLASRFIELSVEDKIDEDCKKYLDSLKYEKIANALPENNIHKLRVN